MTDSASTDKWAKDIDTRIQQFNCLKDHSRNVFEAIALMKEALKNGNKILIFGNGGSAEQAAHFAAELVNKFYSLRIALPAIALTTDLACITSIANDMDFKYVFSRQLEALGKPGDVAVGLTTSGKSPNVLEALKLAGKRNLKTIALCGEHTALLNSPDLNTDVIVSILSSDTPIIQELHLFILHSWAESLEHDFC